MSPGTVTTVRSGKSAAVLRGLGDIIERETMALAELRSADDLDEAQRQRLDDMERALEWLRKQVSG